MSANQENPPAGARDAALGELRGLIAEIDSPRKPATGEVKLIADQLRSTLGKLEALTGKADGGES